MKFATFSLSDFKCHNSVDRFTALHQTMADALLAARLMNQCYTWLITFVISRGVIHFVVHLKLLCFTVSSVVQAWVFVFYPWPSVISSISHLFSITISEQCVLSWYSLLCSNTYFCRTPMWHRDLLESVSKNVWWKRPIIVSSSAKVKSHAQLRKEDSKETTSLKSSSICRDIYRGVCCLLHTGFLLGILFNTEHGATKTSDDFQQAT
jgi:hypothetical protein